MTVTELQQLESLLVQALPDPRRFADRVLGQLVDRLTTDGPAGRPVTVVQAPAPSPDLGDLGVLLAAALGACECWGTDPGCELCDGAGSAGWADPDEELYSEYVLPAVRRRAGTAGQNRTTSRPDPAARDEGERP